MAVDTTWTLWSLASWFFWLLPFFCLLSCAALWAYFSITRAFSSLRSSRPLPTSLLVPVTGTMATSCRDLTVSLYYLHASDFPVLYEMERTYNGNLYPCEYDRYVNTLTNGSSVGVVAKDQLGRIHGYMVFSIQPDSVFLGSVVVSPPFRRLGLGSSMLNWLVNDLPTGYRRPKLFTYARESGLAWQNFLKKSGFTCTQIVDDLFISPDENGYFFERTFPLPAMTVSEETNAAGESV